MPDDVILQVKNISVVYHSPRGDVQATTDVSFDLRKGEALALIGESGCGKTTLSLSLIQMLPNNASVIAGEVLYTRDGKTRDVLKLDPEGAAPVPLVRLRDGVSRRAKRFQPGAAHPRPVHGHGSRARQKR